MPLTVPQKTLRETQPSPIGDLPELPKLDSLSADDQKKLEEWWVKTRVVLERFWRLVTGT